MDDYGRIEKAIRYLDASYPKRPSLGELAKAVGLSEFHLQRLFTKWAGVSPKQFLQVMTKNHARELLVRGRSNLEVTYDLELSSPGRLHDLLVKLEAMTPGEIKSQGDGLTIEYGFHQSPFGEFIIGVTERGVCCLEFLNGQKREQILVTLQKQWPRAVWRQSPKQTAALARQVFNPRKPIEVLARGTPFQAKVWEAVLRIPPGQCLSYKDVAKQIGNEKACRAVGTALGQNPVAILIPCHRVIRETGVIKDYKWGETRKKALLAWEQASRT